MTKLTLCALPLALALSATAAQAEQFEILLVDGGFFPEITYLSPGDTVVFTNTTEVSENVVAADETWSTSQIPPNGSENLVVTAETTLAFVYDEGGEAPKSGALSFAPAPVQ